MWVPPLPRRHDGLCRVLFMEVIIMVRQVKVSYFAEVQGIVSAAAKCYNEVGVHDMKGSIADAKEHSRYDESGLQPSGQDRL